MEGLVLRIAETIKDGKAQAYRAVNFVMVETYWNVGRMIVEEEQGGNARAEYGESLIPLLSERLTAELGKGFNTANLWNFRQFFLTFPILYTLCRELSWSHYRLIMRVEDEQARTYHMNEARDENWSVRTLKRQINSHYYNRLLASSNNAPVQKEAAEKTQAAQIQPQDLLKDPYILEFAQ